MDPKEEERHHIEYLMGKYDFENRFRNLLTQMQDVLEALGVLDKVEINTDLLGQAVLNYFEDVERLKTFESIERINEDKIYSYETFWLLRDKPIQITSDETPYVCTSLCLNSTSLSLVQIYYKTYCSTEAANFFLTLLKAHSIIILRIKFICY